ncbi:hypothetical protein ACHAXR_012553, partial [Thalassiosira sp. AJA248-18]
YSSDEDGIHNWLQPKQTSTLDDLHRDSDDHFAANRGDTDGEKEYNNILDAWTNDADERRSRRLQSLENFNQANAQQESSKTRGHEDRNIPRENNAQLLPTSNNLELPYNDLSQLQAIRSNVPAILMASGPGTGKSHVLSLRIAYLLQKYLKRKQQNGGIMYGDDDEAGDECTTPDSMVILSFTNRDAERLKERALDYLFPNEQQTWRDETSRQLWAGTMHAFSLAILHKYGPSSSPVRVLPARAMRNHVSSSLRTLLNSDDGGEKPSSKNRKLQSRHLQALEDVGHSRSILCQNIVRCIDLWKEANLPLTPPESAAGGEDRSIEGDYQHEYQQKEVRVRKACLELAMRLGISKSSALLALDVYPEYQARHAAAGTADPSDLAGMAYRLLVDDPTALQLLRSKLKHIIVDEYQDMSVSQHSLLRLVVRGVINENEATATGDKRKKRKAERRRRRKLPVLLEPSHQKRRLKASSRSHANFHQSYSVPSIFCAGDASQSIYGWRGGAPELTIHGFRRDFPQGVIAPLGTCYRLPNDIVEAAAMLLPMGQDGTEEILDEETSYDVSPAAAAKLASSIMDASDSGNVDASDLLVDDSNTNMNMSSRHRSAEDRVRLGNQLLLSKGMQKLDSTVVIHGLWDYREEAKYIASTIRRRSKKRRKELLSALSNLDDGISFSPDKELLDLTDVAVMVRSSNQLLAIKEALKDVGIPFVADGSRQNDAHTKEEEEAHNWLSQKRAKQVKTIPMKPATIMTMHRSKGEEFDDVYLAGWTEGSFPHPDAVSSNRVHEERRLAYVALTRSRQRVVITHSFIQRVLNYGRDGRKKYVTGQVQPSRFLYEMVPSKRIEDGAASSNDQSSDIPWLPSSDNKGTVWNRSAGIKEIVAGQNLPDFFQKTYQQPKGYVAKRSELRQFTNVSQASPAPLSTDSGPSKTKHIGKIPQKTPLEIVEKGLRDIIALRKKGASKKYSPIFKTMLASFFQLRRGNALVFASGTKSKQTQNESVYALVEAPVDDLVKKPLGRCTATQLGHYLAYLILKPGNSAPNSNPKSESTDIHLSKLNSEASHKESLDVIANGLRDIVVHRKKGASKKYSPIFKEMLATLFQLRRGNALVFAFGTKSTQTRNESVNALVEASADDLVKKPLGKCTATQLGHYLAYLILTNSDMSN